MPSVQIKDVPEGTHAVLRQRAAAAHQSLQEYLLARLIEEANRPTPDEVLDRAGGRAGGLASAENCSLDHAVRACSSVDASVLAVAPADDGHDGDAARARLRGERLAAPELIDLGVASVIRRQALRGGLDSRRAGLALNDLAELPLQRAPHAPLLWRCWELRENLTIYDAAYVALAEVLHATLLTGDERLASASDPRCTIDILGTRK